MNWNPKRWYKNRILKNESIPDDLWLATLERLKFLGGLNYAEIVRLRINHQ